MATEGPLPGGPPPPSPAAGPTSRPWSFAPLALSLALTGAMAAANVWQGRVAWCACGSSLPWSFDIWSAHNSQHLVDPYSATHVLHGIGFYGLLWLVARRLSIPWRFAVATALEAAWEVMENGPAIIEKYREATISLDYFGDSVLNSVADVAMCAGGFVLAARLPRRLSLALFAATELVLLLTIRDSLLVNMLMLVWPVEALKQWQMGAAAVP